jgi:ubiquinone/menaquinone biosynthesis C-methylase UbiE
MKDETSWGKVARWYDDLLEGNSDSYQAKVILPNLLRLMEIKAGEVVLDLACGQGFFSEHFAKAGAKVIGIDLSAELIALAKSRVSEGTFFVAPAHQLSMIDTGSVSKVAIVLAIQNIREFSETFAECHRMLKPNGRLFIVLNHPAFRVPDRSRWGFDDETGTQFRRLDGYLSESKVSIQMHPSKPQSVETVSFHRPLQTYGKALANHGFKISRLEEWISHKKSQPGPRQSAEDRARKEFPLFLFIEAVK